MLARKRPNAIGSPFLLDRTVERAHGLGNGQGHGHGNVQARRFFEPVLEQQAVTKEAEVLRLCEQQR
jgi:hypothetical protein